MKRNHGMNYPKPKGYNGKMKNGKMGMPKAKGYYTKYKFETLK